MKKALVTLCILFFLGFVFAFQATALCYSTSPDACSEYDGGDWSQGSCHNQCGSDSCVDAGCCDGYPDYSILRHFHKCTSSCSAETCNNVDDDCDGSIDEDFAANDCEGRCTLDGGAWLPTWPGDAASSGASCCGNDPGEHYNWYQYEWDDDWAIDTVHPEDNACCDNENDCVVNHVCYAEGTRGSPPQNICDGGIIYQCNAGAVCDIVEAGGVTYYCIGVDGGTYEWRERSLVDPDACEGVCDYNYKDWIPESSSFNGATNPNCCGDDAGEYYNWQQWDANGAATPTPTTADPTKDACCPVSTDCVWQSASTGGESTCNAQGTSGSADSLCYDKIWYYCNAQTLCDQYVVGAGDTRTCYLGPTGYFWATSAGAPGELCSDGVDNNCNGYTDDADATCSIVLELDPSTVNTNQPVSTTVTTAIGGQAPTYPAGTTKNICDGSGCTAAGACATPPAVCADELNCQFTAPGSAGTYTYYACLGENSASDSLTVNNPAVCTQDSQCSLPAPNPAGASCFYNDRCSAGYCTYDTAFPKPTCFGDGTIYSDTCYYTNAEQATCTATGWSTCTDGASEECLPHYNDSTTCYHSRMCTLDVGCEYESDDLKGCDDSVCTATGWDNSQCPSVCGDGILQGEEECDGENLNEKNCSSIQGYDGEPLACYPPGHPAECTFNTSGCDETPENCANGVDDDGDGWVDEQDATCGVNAVLEPNVTEPSEPYDYGKILGNLLLNPEDPNDFGNVTTATFTANDGLMYPLANSAPRYLCDDNACTDTGECAGSLICADSETPFPNACTFNTPTIEGEYEYHFCFGEHDVPLELIVCTAGNCPNCGDGVIQPGEECDFNATGDPIFNFTLDTCQEANESYYSGLLDCNAAGTPEECKVDTSGCTAEGCGNNVWEALLGEECDDGNLLPGDGCNETCGLEPGGANITGYVWTEDGDPISGASIFIVAPPEGYLNSTNGVGEYRMHDIPQGTHRVSAEKIGYTTVTKELLFVASSTHSLNFTLESNTCDQCADVEGRCAIECNNAPGCELEVPEVCVGSKPGAWVYDFSKNEYAYCCAGTPRKPKLDVGVEVSGCMDDLVQFTRVVEYLGQPVTIHAYTWEPCHS